MTEVRGEIKNLNEKRFGFIVPDKGQEFKEDIFFHQSALVGVSFDALEVKDKVVAEVSRSDKGPKATQVKLA